MLNLCNTLKKYRIDLNIHVTADGNHVKYSWKKDLYPGGRTFSFKELESLSAEEIEEQLILAIENWAETVEKLESIEPCWW